MTATTSTAPPSSATIKAELAVRVAALAERGIVPGLGTVLVGDVAATGMSGPNTAIAPRSASGACGAICRRAAHSAKSSASSRRPTPTLRARGFSSSSPPAWTKRHPRQVDPAKDVDGLHPTNLG